MRAWIDGFTVKKRRALMPLTTSIQVQVFSLGLTANKAQNCHCICARPTLQSTFHGSDSTSALPASRPELQILDYPKYWSRSFDTLPPAGNIKAVNIENLQKGNPRVTQAITQGTQ